MSNQHGPPPTRKKDQVNAILLHFFFFLFLEKKKQKLVEHNLFNAARQIILQDNELDDIEGGCDQSEPPLRLEEAWLMLSTHRTFYCPNPTYNASINAVYPGTCSAMIKLSGL